jgi:hypothetical protein
LIGLCGKAVKSLRSLTLSIVGPDGDQRIFDVLSVTKSD